MKAWIIWIARVLCAGSLPKKEALIDVSLEVKKLITLFGYWQYGKLVER
jgi:hypothetical protein